MRQSNYRKYFGPLSLALILFCATAYAVVKTDVLKAGNIQLSGNTVSTLNTNGDLTVDLNGTGSTIFADLTAARVPYLDASKKLKSSTTNQAELEFLGGVLSSVCGKDDSCTLTNKTLTSPAINGANFNFGTATNTNRLLLPSETSTNFLSLSNGAGLLAYDTTQSKPVYNNGTAWVAVGSGSGGEKNYIGNPDAESGTTGWTTYKDAAGVKPVDCTGGSPAFTWTAITDPALSGTKVFNRGKAGLDNQQGEGVSYDFTIDNADKAKVLQVEFDYVSTDTAFIAGTPTTDSDLEIYVYDVTNAVLIQPTTYKLFSSAISPPSHFTSNFQTASNSTSYRLCIHTTGGFTNPYQVYFDSFKVTPSKYVYGTPITDWKQYSPTLVGFGTIATSDFYWRRVGSNLEVNGYWTDGTVAASTASITLPSAAINTSVITRNNTTSNPGQIIGEYRNNATANHGFMVTATATDSTLVYFGGLAGGAVGLTPALGNAIATSSSTTAIKFSVPILGWSSSVQMSDSADSRAVAFHGTTAPAVALATSGSPTLIPSMTAETDTHGAFSATTKLYTVPVAGKYHISGSLWYANNTTGRRSIHIYKNGVQTLSGSQVLGQSGFETGVNVSGLIDCIAGDTIGLYYRQDSGGSLNTAGTTTNNFLSIERLSGPSAIGATETIAASYIDTAGSALGNATFATYTYATKVTDTHGAYASGTYTIPAAGRYRVSASIATASTTITGTNSVQIRITQNGTVKLHSQTGGTAATTVYQTQANGVLDCAAGDTIVVQTQNTTGAVNASTTSGINTFSIHRIGL